MSKKITMATVKSFVKKNKDNLYISNRFSFDGMIDGTRKCDDQSFRKVELGDMQDRNSLGIDGARFVGSGGNYLHGYDDEKFTGIAVSNSCDCFVIAIPKT